MDWLKPCRVAVVNDILALKNWWIRMLFVILRFKKYIFYLLALTRIIKIR